MLTTTTIPVNIILILTPFSAHAELNFIQTNIGGEGYLESALFVEEGVQGVSQLRTLLSEQATSYPGVCSTQHLVVGVS